MTHFGGNRVVYQAAGVAAKRHRLSGPVAPAGFWSLEPDVLVAQLRSRLEGLFRI